MPALFGVSWSSGVEDAWANVAAFVPKLLGAVAVLVIGLLVSRALRRVVESAARGLRLDRLVERSGLGGFLEKAGFGDAAAVLGRLTYYGLVLLTLQMSIDVLGESRIQDALSSLVGFLPQLAVALVIAVVTGVIATRVREVVGRSLRALSYGAPLATAAFAATWVVGGFAALNQLQIANEILTTLFQATVYTVALILVIKFGIGGVACARDRFWPRVYDKVQGPPPAPEPMVRPGPTMRPTLPPGQMMGVPGGGPTAAGYVPAGYVPAPGYAPAGYVPAPGSVTAPGSAAPAQYPGPPPGYPSQWPAYGSGPVQAPASPPASGAAPATVEDAGSAPTSGSPTSGVPASSAQPSEGPSPADVSPTASPVPTGPTGAPVVASAYPVPAAAVTNGSGDGSSNGGGNGSAHGAVALDEGDGGGDIDLR